MGRFDHLVHTFEKQITHWGDFMPTVQAYFRGQDCMDGAEFYSPYRCYIKEAFLDRESNFHAEEELLSFVGYDMTDPFGSFDAEIEFWIGKDLNHMEKHIITEPTIVRIPPFTWHCPLEYKRVGKPVYLQVLGTRGKFGCFVFRQDMSPEGYHIDYNGLAGASKKCVLNPEKPCTVCGKCMTDKFRPDDPKTATESALRFKSIKL